MNRRFVMRILSSWWLLAGLLMALVVAYLLYSAGGNPVPPWLAFLLHTPAGLTLYLGTAVNLLAVSIRIVHRRLQRRSLSPEELRSFDVHVEIPVTDETSVNRVLDGLGFDRGVLADFTGARRRSGTYSFLPGTIFRAGVVLILLSALTSAHSRRSADVTLSAGQQKNVLGETISLSSLAAPLPDDYLLIGEDDGFALRDVAAGVSVSGEEAVVTPGFPSHIRGRYYRVVRLGYAQQITAISGRTLTSLTADLDLLPPGRTDVVSLPSRSRFLTFTFAPDKTLTKGALTGKQYDLAHPRYRIVIQSGIAGEQPSVRLARPGGWIAAGPVQIALGMAKPFVRIEATIDPGLFWLYAGVVIASLGVITMFSRFFWYERETAVMLQGNTLYAGGRREFFKRAGVLAFEERCR